MTRAEAISALISAWFQRDGEFCVGAEEYAESQAKLTECLKTLGVSEEEQE